jgi:CYTH domain-containing protein
MGYEIERKFLVEGNYKADAFKSMFIKQGYLSQSETSVIRVRIKDEKAYVTIKSAAIDGELKRHEWEYEIPVKDAEEMLQLCEDALIEKKRYLVQVGSHIFEVDEFYGKNEGLCIAEVELESEDETYAKPDWLGLEVTGNVRYYNSFLSLHPYTEWRD